ncbi:hypothetical protein AB1Y20_019612 [Prymnesium parvum]|uniref:Uncharacterized protein n=1 Tax=Prymnesium parvum TaxID=97485 RepID=A0AB34JRG5_PRYPA
MADDARPHFYRVQPYGRQACCAVAVATRERAHLSLALLQFDCYYYSDIELVREAMARLHPLNQDGVGELLIGAHCLSSSLFTLASSPQGLARCLPRLLVRLVETLTPGPRPAGAASRYLVV